MNEIEKSIYIQKQIFYAYQPSLLEFLNSEEGKYFLYKKLGTEFPKRIVQIGRNHLIEHLEGKEYRATFYPRQIFTDLLLPLIQKGQLAKVKYSPYTSLSNTFAFYAGLKKEKLPRIYQEELIGYNPLLYNFLQKYPHLAHLTATFNPASGAASPVAGFAAAVNSGGFASFGAMHDASGTGGNAGGNQYAYIGYNTAWVEMDRGFCLFDTSTLTASATISSATFQLYVSSSIDPFSQSVRMVQSTIASTSTIAASDYQGTVTNTTAQATSDLTIAGMTTSAYNTWTLNSTGIGNINLTGISKFGTRMVSDCVNSAPSASGNQADYILVDTGGSANPPELVVTYTLAEQANTININQAVQRAANY